VAGLVGFWIVTGLASRADTLVTMQLLIRVSRPFGRLITASGISLTVLGLATAFAIGQPVFGPLQGAPVSWMFVSTLLMLPIFLFLVLVYPRFAGRMGEAVKAAEVAGRITTELTAAWADPIYRFARRYELVAVIVVLALMFSKPF
jgi:hypothetical protein